MVFRTPFLLIHERPAPRPRAHFVEPAQGAVSLSYPSDSSAVLDAASDTGGVVVLHDTFATGWKATIDGRAAEVFAVNVLSRGVVVPKGSHRIRMSYLPPGLIAGAATSAATLLAMIAIVIVRRR